MRLNHIKLFYVLLLHFYSKRSEEWRPATAMPPARVAGHGQGPCRGGRLRSWAPQGWSHAARAARKGAAASRHSRQQAQSPTSAAANRRSRSRPGLLPVDAAPAAMAGAYRRRRPLRGWRQPAREAPAGTAPARAAARGSATPVRPLGQRWLPKWGPPVGKATASDVQHTMAAVVAR
ncbi:hypothetical protein BHM03_00027940 [Ensete ventricosum]|nr:hypothetical protein BHM03_00027940 [Ensete ventricosum]